MAWKGRIEFGGAIYHVLNRGDRREPIVQSDGELEQALNEKVSENHRLPPSSQLPFGRSEGFLPQIEIALAMKAEECLRDSFTISSSHIVRQGSLRDLGSLGEKPGKQPNE